MAANVGSARDREQGLGYKIAGRYRTLEVIGTGRFGTVYRAMDEQLSRVVALKVLRSEFSNDPRHAALLLLDQGDAGHPPATSG